MCTYNVLQIFKVHLNKKTVLAHNIIFNEIKADLSALKANYCFLTTKNALLKCFFFLL